MRIVVGAVGLVSLVAFAPSCGGSGSTSSIPIDRLGAEYATVFCHKAFTCCDAAELPGNSATAVDEPTCRSTVGARIGSELAANQASIAAGRLVYHGDRARDCLDVVAGLACAQWGADEELARFPDCLMIYEGKVAPGGACSRDAECDRGTCEAGACLADLVLGAPCGVGLCEPGSTCIYDANDAPTVCSNPMPDGAPCSYNSDCAGGFCESNAAGDRVCGPPTMCNGV